MSTAQDYWKEFEETSAKESGGGIVAKARIETGYKVYAAGVAQEDTFFAAPAGDKYEKAQNIAKSAARKLGDPKWGIQIRVYLKGATSRGQPATWKGDRFFNVGDWTPACKEVVVPSLHANSCIPLPWEGWVRIGFKPDPHFVTLGDAGKTKKDQDGNLKFPQIAYVVESFASQAEAMAGVSAAGSADSTLDFPDGWDEETWRTAVVAMAEMKDSGTSLPEIAAAYGVPVPIVVKALSELVPF